MARLLFWSDGEPKAGRSPQPVAGTADFLNAFARGLMFAARGHFGATYYVPMVVVPPLKIGHFFIPAKLRVGPKYGTPARARVIGRNPRPRPPAMPKQIVSRWRVCAWMRVSTLRKYTRGSRPLSSAACTRLIIADAHPQASGRPRTANSSCRLSRA